MSDNNFSHVMVDLETLGLAPDAVVLSIGAVEFPYNPSERIAGNKFYLELSQESQPDRTVDESTLEWWGKQPILMPRGTIEAKEAAKNFNHFLAKLPKPPMLWAQGADFDFPKLEHLFDSLGLPKAWKYNSKRDLRTLISLCPGVVWPSNPIAHNALSDAVCQAEMAYRCLAVLRGATYE